MKTFTPRPWFAVLLIAACLLSVYTYSRAQETPPASGRLQVLGINARTHQRVEITVSIVDPAGRPIQGLNTSNFTVEEDGKQVGIQGTSSITDENIPLGIVLVIDTSRSMFGPPLEKAKEAAKVFVDQVRDIDELALVSFASKVKEIQPMTKDRSLIKEKIDGLHAQG